MSVELTLAAGPRGALSVYPIEFARHFGVQAFVTDRTGGVSPAPFDSLNLGDHVGDDPANVQENRRRVADAIGVDASRLVIVNQVHGRDVINANQATPESSGDVIIDYGDEFAIAVLVADCLPILLVDEDSPTLAVVHAGWRGLESNVLESALENFEHHDAVHAFLGPSDLRRGLPGRAGRRRALQRRRGRGDAGHGRSLSTRPTGRRARPAPRVEDHRRPHHRGHAVDRRRGAFFSDRAARPCGRFGLVARRVIA